MGKHRQARQHHPIDARLFPRSALMPLWLLAVGVVGIAAAYALRPA